MIASYRDLRVWQAAMQMVEHVYSATRLFPPGEMYGLAAQLRRAAVSVPSNIAEGHVRSYTREFLHCLSVAHGSLAELQTQIEIAMRLGYIAPDCGGELLDDASALSRQLHALRASLSARLEKSRLPTAKVNSSAKSQPPTPNPDVP